MRIAAWSVVRVTHRNLDPEWHYAGRDVPKLPGVRVALRAGDHMGEGYAPFLPHLDSTPAALAAAARDIAATLPGAELSDIDACILRLGPCQRARNAARSAVEMALLDLAARTAGVSVATLLGGTLRPIAVLRIIPVKSPERMAEVAEKYVAEGFGALKLKATGDLDADVVRIVAVRRAVGAGITLTVDANQAYDFAGAQALETALRPQDIWSLEQPVTAADRPALAKVRQGAKARIEADEGLFDARDLDVVLATGAADGISMKLARSGGLLPSRDMGLRATAGGLHVRLGTAFGGPLVTLATATLAALCPTDGHAECAEFAHFDDEEHTWPTIVDGVLMPPEGPGFGQTRLVNWTGVWAG